MREAKVNWLVIIFLSCFSICQLCFADSVDTELSSQKLFSDETLTLTFTYHGQSSNHLSPNFSVLEKDFRILGTNYGNAVNMINGVTSIQTFWQLTLEPKKTGRLIIPKIDFGDVQSFEREIIIEKNAQNTPRSNTNTDVFIRSEIDNGKPYVQSQMIYTFKLFYQSPLDHPKIELPKIKDATLVQLSEGNQYQKSINGNPYYVYEKNFALFPQKTGDMIVPPLHFSAVRYDMNANGFDYPFYMPSEKHISLSTESQAIHVQNVPADYRGSTWLPANKLTLTENWSANPDHWEVGNPIIRTITLQAEGLRADQLPDLTFEKINDVSMYVDPPRRSNRVDNHQVIGTLEQKITYIPNTSTALTIPEVKLDWWNLQTNTNATATLNRLSISAVQSAVPTSTTPLQRQSEIISTPSYDQKPLNINPQTELKGTTTPFYLSLWFWIASALLLLWLLTIAIILKNRRPNPSTLPLRQDNETSESLSFNEKYFRNACINGDAVSAQHYLLAWTKTLSPTSLPNLKQLQSLVADDHFKSLLNQLEEVLYANTSENWDGKPLFHAFKKIKKHVKLPRNDNAKRYHANDGLPPLNP